MKNSSVVVQYQIMLNPEDVLGFVQEADRCEFDVDISYNSFMVDAKSIIGVYGLDLSRVLTVYCHGYSEEFEKYLKQFEKAC